MNDIDTEYTDEIVCPYCGHKQSDSATICVENEDVEQETDCDKCDKRFFFMMHVIVNFSSRKYPEAKS